MTPLCSAALVSVHISSAVAHFAFKHERICRTVSVDLRLQASFPQKSDAACYNCGFLKFLNCNIWTHIQYICYKRMNPVI